jgi:hypothetical protein
MSLVLTERDRAVLLVLWKLRFVTLKQMHRFAFQGLNRSTATNRLLALQEAGYLEIKTKYMHTVTDKDRKVVLITRAGNTELIRASMLAEANRNDVPKANQWTLSRPALMHDLQVVDLSMALFKSLDMDVKAWRSDHDLRIWIHRENLKHWGFRVPDGLFNFRVAGGAYQIVLENEFARYSAKSFAQILKKLRWQYPEALVLIVCAEQGHMATMCRWAHYSRIWYDRKENLMFGHFPDVASNGARARWITLNGGMAPDHALTKGIEYQQRSRSRQTGS